jgi:hypothetical protein
MTEEEIKRLEDCEEAIKEYYKQLLSVKSDLEVILEVTNVVEQVRGKLGIMEQPRSDYSGTPPPDPVLLEKYRAFLKRHEG